MAFASSVQTKLAAPSTWRAAVLKLTFPDASTLWLSHVTQPVNSDTHGPMKNRIRGGTSIVRGSSDSRGHIQSPRTSITVEDPDDTLRGKLSSSRGRITAQLYEAFESPVTAAEWPLLIDGRVVSVELVGIKLYSLTLAQNDDMVRAKIIPGIQATPGLFPSASSGDIYSRRLPLVLGWFDSDDGTVEGKIGILPAYYCHAAGGFFYAYCGVGNLFHVERVSVDGTLLADSAWSRVTVVMPGLNTYTAQTKTGLCVTMIKLNADPGTAAIMWDGCGLTRAGKGTLKTMGSGELRPPVPLTNPIEQFRFVMNNFVLADWTIGTAYDDDDGEGGVSTSIPSPADRAPLDSTSLDALTAEFFTERQRGAMYIDQPIKSEDFINSFCESYGLQVFWTEEMKLGLRRTTPNRTALYLDSPWVRFYEPMAPLTGTLVQEDIASEITAPAWPLPGGSARGQLSAAETGAPLVASTIRRPYGAAQGRIPWEGFDSARVVYSCDKISNVNSAGAVWGELKDGASVGTWPDVKDPAIASLYDATQTGGARPLLTLAANYPYSVKPFLKFDGTDDYLAGPGLGNVFDALTFDVHVGFVLSAATTNNATIYDNHALITSTGGYFGIYAKNTGPTYNLYGAVLDSGGTQIVTGGVAIELGKPYVVRLSFRSGSRLYLTVNRIQSSSVAIGTINAGYTGGVLRIGANYNATQFFSGLIHSVVIHRNNLTNQGLTTGIEGGGWHQRIHEYLSDAIGVAQADWE